MGWACHVVRMGERRSAYRALVVKPEETVHLEDTSADGRIFKKWDVVCGLDSSCSTQGKVARYREYSNELSGCRKCCELLDYLCSPQLLKEHNAVWVNQLVNRLTPNDPYMGRTALLTSKRCILYIYSTNVGTEYFKHALYSPFFSLQNVVRFIMITCLVPVLFTFYIQDVLKLKKKIIPAPKD